jgi:hypothetical protein
MRLGGRREGAVADFDAISPAKRACRIARNLRFSLVRHAALTHPTERLRMATRTSARFLASTSRVMEFSRTLVSWLPFQARILVGLFHGRALGQWLRRCSWCALYDRRRHAIHGLSTHIKFGCQLTAPASAIARRTRSTRPGQAAVGGGLDSTKTVRETARTNPRAR